MAMRVSGGAGTNTRERQALTVATRFHKPPAFGGTDTTWRVLCDLYPAAETPEVVMAVVEYCAARKLDPLRRPVHVVPMWNARLRRKVQVVMQGINEVETTAARTGKWAGMDPPKWGETIKRTFRGTIEDDNGTSRNIELTISFPLSCAVTVYRMVGNERRGFTEELFWEECYARASFRSEVPNARWQQAPRQMLHKCTKAAVLRAAFPEEGFGFTSEEMEDHETDTGGIVIEGNAERQPTPEEIEQDRQADEAYGTEPEPPHPLDEPNGTAWFRNLRAALDLAQTADQVVEIAGHRSVQAVLAADSDAPPLIKQNVTDMLARAHERFAATTESGKAWETDPIADLLLEIDRMDLVDLERTTTSAEWRAKVRAACELPPDEDRVREAIETRKATLKAGGTP